jgi:hypothetical protein
MPEIKLFTIAEANAHIPKLEALLTQIQTRYVKIQSIIGKIEPGTPAEAIEQRLGEHPELRGLFQEIQRCVKAIEEIGAHFKGVELGLVDFPFMHGDEIALLCWQFGEKEIRWWHTMEGGFTGRRPLPGATERKDLN